MREKGTRKRRAGWAMLGFGGLATAGLVVWIFSGVGETRVSGAPGMVQAGIGDRTPPMVGPPYVKPVGPPEPEPGPPETTVPGSLEERAPANEETPRLPPRSPDYPSVTPLPQPSVPAAIPDGLVNGHVFGRDLYGVDPQMLDRLQAAERLMTESGEASGFTPEERFGVASISGYRTGSRGHSRGIAVDINYYANPYIMHEKGESELDAQLTPVYHRIARLMLGRDSVIPEQITMGSPAPERTLRLYQQLLEESRAMAGYFNLMQDRAALQRQLHALKSPIPQELAPGSPEAVQRQMAADYVALSGRAGPLVDGLTYPEPTPALRSDGRPCDRPFEGDPRYRAPEMGFLNLRPDLVRALTVSGLRWGATDFGGQSGDVMHFYLPESRVSRRR